MSAHGWQSLQAIQPSIDGLGVAQGAEALRGPA